MGKFQKMGGVSFSPDFLLGGNFQVPRRLGV